MARSRNIILDQGSDFSETITVSDPVDITGYTAASQFRKSFYSLTAYDFDTSVANTSVTIAMSANTSSNIEPGRYRYDVEVIAPNGDVTRVREGIVTITPNMTKV